jgi:hypothetical protein
LLSIGRYDRYIHQTLPMPDVADGGQGVPLDQHQGSTSGCCRPADRAHRWFAAHELRTPLQAIQGGVALLLEERGNGLSPLQLEAVGVITAAAIELERCTSRLAELAALDAGPALQPRAICLDALLRGVELSGKLNAISTAPGAEEVEVMAVPELAQRALHHLATVGRAGGADSALTCMLETLDAETVMLALAIGPPPAGDGSVAWQLAAALFERAGISARVTDTGGTRLTLRRARRAPI